MEHKHDVLGEFLASATEARALVARIMAVLRSPGQDGSGVLGGIKNDRLLSRYRAICHRLEVLGDRKVLQIPKSLEDCTRLGGHFVPFLILLEELTERGPSSEESLQPYVALAEELVKKITQDCSRIAANLQDLTCKAEADVSVESGGPSQ